MLCSVVKHLGSGRALKKWGTLDCVSCFPLYFFVLYRFLRALQQNSTVEGSIFVNSADLGGCYPPRPSVSVDNTLLDLQNSLHPTTNSIIAK